MNIITNPLVRQYPFETSYKTKKMYANDTIVTHQPGGNSKTISYGPPSAGGGTGGGGGQGIDMKRSPLVNRRRSSSVTLPQPPITGDRYFKGDIHNSMLQGGGDGGAGSGGGTITTTRGAGDGRNSR